MDATLAVVLSILGSVISVASFTIARKDKSNKDASTESYKNGQLDEKLKNILEKLEKIEKKLDTFEREVKDIVKEEIKKHIEIYHKGE